jgi:ketosteroid isomerase-like protein
VSEDERAILALLDERVAAIRAKDARRANALLADELVAFEMAPPLALEGEAARDVAALQDWLDSWDGEIAMEIARPVLHVSGDVAFCHSLSRLAGRRAGRDIDFWMRSTLGLRKAGAEWRIVHGHTSVPFRMDGSFQAALDLEP